MDRCPGQDLRYLKPEDVYIIRCPHCKGEVEFFKDEPTQRCPKCKEKVSNPKIDMGCAKWCAFAEECLGVTPESPGVVQSLSEPANREPFHADLVSQRKGSAEDALACECRASWCGHMSPLDSVVLSTIPCPKTRSRT